MILFSLPKKELALLFLILIIGSFLRLYRLPETMQFLGDQGRDALIVKRILIDHDPTLIGPVTSVGNMYLGPFYYYFMLPWLALSYPSPLGPAYGVAFVGIATIILLFFLVRQMFGSKVALLSAFIYSVLDIAVEYSRFSWNPNIVPLVSIAIIASLYKTLTEKNYKYLSVSIIAFGIITQLHYLSGLMLLVIAGVVVKLYKNQSKDRKEIVKNIFVGLLAVLLLMSPLILFDIRHNFTNLVAFKELLSGPEEHIRAGTSISKLIGDIDDNAYLVTSSILGIKDQPWGMVLTATLILSLVVLYKKGFSEHEKIGVSLLLLWLIISALGLSLYNHAIYDHYLVFIYPASVILLSFLVVRALQKFKVLGIVLSVVTALIVLKNLESPSAFKTQSWTISDIKSLAETIQQSTNSDIPYNIVVYSDVKDAYGMNYRYFLETMENPPEDIENYTNLKELYIINEKPETSPFGKSVYEIEVAKLDRVADVIDHPYGPTNLRMVEKTQTEE